MFEKIIYINDRFASIQLSEGTSATINLMNLHIIFEDDYKTILGEVDDLDGDVVKVRFLGEIVDNELLGGVIRKPSLDAKIRVISEDEIQLIVGKDEKGFMKFGMSPFYNDYPVYLDVNKFFSNHFAIFGNSGSGKSCGISRLFQNMFHDERLFPYKANIILFDSSGEYYNAFNNLNTINSNYHYRFYSTNEVEGQGEKLRIPLFLLNEGDLALLLQATNHSQLPIIERMLKLARVFSQNDIDANNYKNHIIAKAITTILYTNESAPNKRNEIFSILSSCSTPEFNLEAILQGVGYTRKFKECFLIDNQGQFTESVLLNEYVASFIKSEYDNYEPNGDVYYDLEMLEKALNFTLISEGWLRNENTYADSVTLKVRLHALITGENAKFFDYPDYVSLETYLSSLLINNGNKYQIVNINFDDVDDDFAKTVTKIYSRLVFEFAKGLQERASIPFHIVVEEAHRYVQNDTDRFLIGYNIFERIAKEGRKYGVMLGLVSQRPVELSDTVISQCSNFMIFKMNHPVDVEYIRKMVPNISDEIVEKQKSLQSGTCLGFGVAFRVPLIVKMEIPDPRPWSGNCDVVTIWNGNNKSIPNKLVRNDREFEVRSKEEKKDILPNITSRTNGVSEPINMSFPIDNPIIDDAAKMNSLPKKVVSSKIDMPVIPVDNKIEIPKVPFGMGVTPEPVNDTDFSDFNSADNTLKKTVSNMVATVPSAVSSDEGFTNISGGRNVTDNLLHDIVGEQENSEIGGFSISNMSTQSVIPDFTMTSAQEREFSIPTTSRSIPSFMEIAAKRETVSPTVDVEEKSDYGTVRIVPPTPTVGISNKPLFAFGGNNENDGMPTSEGGKPLVNLIG